MIEAKSLQDLYDNHMAAAEEEAHFKVLVQQTVLRLDEGLLKDVEKIEDNDGGGVLHVWFRENTPTDRMFRFQLAICSMLPNSYPMGQWVYEVENEQVSLQLTIRLNRNIFYLQCDNAVLSGKCSKHVSSCTVQNTSITCGVSE